MTDHSVEGRDTGYRGATACTVAGITYRQLDYWARTGLVEPSLRTATGSGTQRLYSFQDVIVLKVVKRLLDSGISLQNVRIAIDHLRKQGVDDLGTVTIMSDGASVYECRTDDDIRDLLAGGQAVFGIAVGKVATEVEASLLALPGPIAASDEASDVAADELSLRRARRNAV